MKIGPALVLVATVLAMGGCNRDHYYNHHTYGNDEGERYLQRKDVVTLSAGDAKEVNARTHMLAAWPRGVGDRRIAMSGPRAVRAIDCYNNPQRQQQQGAAGFGQQTSINIQVGGQQQQQQQQQKNC